MKKFFNSNKKIITIVAGIMLVVLCIIIYGILQPKPITLKMELFTVEINEELDKNAETYLENVTNDNATVDFANVDTTNLGEYVGTIKVNDVDYEIAFKVVDTKAPTLKTTKVKFSFSLDDSIETVNETINNDLMIEDNSKEEFAPLTILEEIPEVETEEIVKVSIKDASGNESDTLELTIQFTEDGEEKEGLQKEDKKAESKGTVTNKKSQQSNTPNSPTDTPKNESPSNGGSSNDNTSSSNGDNTNTEKPAPTPTPKPVPTPDPKPDPKPDYVCPTGVIDKMKPCDYYEFTPVPNAIEVKFFNSDAEINAYYIDLDDNKFKVMRGSVRVNNGSFLYSAEIIAR